MRKVALNSKKVGLVADSPEDGLKLCSLRNLYTKCQTCLITKYVKARKYGF